MTGWQDYVGVRHQNTIMKTGDITRPIRQNEQAFELNIQRPQDRTLHFLSQLLRCKDNI